MLKPEDYTVQEAEFLFSCELNQLKKRELISEQQHAELTRAHFQLSQQRKDHKPMVQQTIHSSNPQPPKDTRTQTINLFLILGTLFLTLAGLIFSTASWMSVGAVGRGIILALNITFFFGVSLFTEKKLGLQKTATTFWNLALCLTPLIIVTLSGFGALGDYFSFYGEGRFLLGIMTSLLMIGLTQLSFKRFNQPFFLLIRHLFEILTQGFVWFWISSVLTLTGNQPQQLCLIGWGILLTIESFVLSRLTTSPSKERILQKILSPYLIQWLPYKQLIFQWGVILFGINSLIFSEIARLFGESLEIELFFMIIGTLLSFALVLFSKTESKQSYRQTIPFGIQLLILGNFIAAQLESSFSFIGLNLIFLMAYLILTYRLEPTPLQQTLRNTFRINVIGYLFYQIIFNSFELTPMFFISWILMGAVFMEGFLRNRTHSSKNAIFYSLINIWSICFGVFLGANLNITFTNAVLIGTLMSLTLQTIWLILNSIERSVEKGYWFLISLTLSTYTLVYSFNTFIISILCLIGLSAFGIFSLCRLSFKGLIKEWTVISFILLNLITISKETYSFIFFMIPIALIGATFANSTILSRIKSDYLEFLIRLLQINSLFLIGLQLFSEVGFTGVFTLQTFALSIHYLSEIYLDMDSNEKKKKETQFIYSIAFLLGSICLEWIPFSPEDRLILCLLFPLIATILANRWIYQNESSKLIQAEYVYLILFNLCLGSHALSDDLLIYSILAFTFYLAQLILVYLQSDKKYRWLGILSLLIFTLVRFSEFFLSIHWLIYLIVFGIGFVLFAMKQESRSRKNPINKK